MFILAAFLTSCISYFFDFCSWEGNIFGFYPRWYARLPYMLQKPLGACIYCFNTWIGFGVYAYLVYKFNYDIIWVIPFVSLSYFILRIINKLNLE